MNKLIKYGLITLGVFSTISFASDTIEIRKMPSSGVTMHKCEYITKSEIYFKDIEVIEYYYDKIIYENEYSNGKQKIINKRDEKLMKLLKQNIIENNGDTYQLYYKAKSPFDIKIKFKIFR